MLQLQEGEGEGSKRAGPALACTAVRWGRRGGGGRCRVKQGAVPNALLERLQIVGRGGAKGGAIVTLGNGVDWEGRQ